MSAIIQIDQVQGGPISFGAPGIARDDLWQNGTVTLTSFDVSGTYLWELLDKPAGSTALLSASTVQVVTFVPDLPGSYRIRLTVNGGGTGNIQGKIAAVTKDAVGVITRRGWRIPAYNENKESPNEDNFDHGSGPNTRGWNPAYEFIFNDILASLGGVVPPIGAHLSGEVLGIAGVTGGDAFLNPTMVISDGTRILVPDGFSSFSGTGGFHIARLDGTGDVLLDTNLGAFPVGQLIYTDIVSSGSQLWLFGVSKAGNGFILEVISGVTITYGIENDISPGDSLISADFDGTNLWAVSANSGTLYQINPATPGIPLNSVVGGVAAGVLRIDTNGANYGDSNPRGFVFDLTGFQLVRFTLSPIAADAFLALATGISGLAVGVGAFSGVVFYNSDPTSIAKSNVDLVTGQISNGIIGTFDTGIHSVDYEPSTDKLWVTGENASNIVVARIDPGSLIVESSVTLETDGVNFGYASYSTNPARVRFINGSAFVGDPRINDPSNFGDVYRINLTGPLVATKVPVPGPKTLAFLSYDWVQFIPDFQTLAGDASLGNGTIDGTWRKVGNTIEVRIHLIVGATTNFGSGPFIVPLPNNMVSDQTQFSPFGAAVDMAAIALSASTGTIVPIISTAGLLISVTNPGGLVSGPGDQLFLHFSTPVI
jgi:hypothetical protein